MAFPETLSLYFKSSETTPIEPLTERVVDSNLKQQKNGHQQYKSLIKWKAEGQLSENSFRKLLKLIDIELLFGAIVILYIV